MANPAFPPSMQPGMAGMPHGGIPAAGAMRRGTPKAVPIVVSAGLAVGVFCGLYFGLGTGEPEEATATTAKASAPQGPQTAAPATNEVTNFKSGPGKHPGSGSAGSGSAAVAAGSDAGSGSAAAGSGSGSAVAVGSGSGATPGSGSGATAGSAAPELTVELTFAVTPANAVLTLDGEPVVGGKATITLSGAEKTVRLVAKAGGYKVYDKKLTLSKDTESETIEIKLAKRSGGSSSGSHSSGKDTSHDPPGGLIDL